MSARIAVTTVTELDGLGLEEIKEGYRDGYGGDSEPGDNRSDAYWHGWRNGAVDGGHREKDAAQAALAHDLARSGYLKKQ